MVTVIDLRTAKNNLGEEFTTLVLQGPPVAVQSKETGRFYITARKCSIPCTFDLVMAKAMIGQQMPGTIDKVPCEPYDYVVPESGEIVQLDFSWAYNPDDKPKAPDFPTVQFSANGHLVH